MKRIKRHHEIPNDIINNIKKSETWKTQFTIANNFIYFNFIFISYR